MLSLFVFCTLNAEMEIHGLCIVQSLFFFAVIILQNGCDGFCFVGNLLAEMTVSRRLRYYCEYIGADGHSLKLFPGSNLYLVDQCLDCKCTMDGLRCCGFGYAGGKITIKKDCKLLHDGCQPLIVKSINQNLDCFTGLPINFTSLAKQLPHPDNTYESPIQTTTAPTTTTPVTKTLPKAEIGQDRTLPPEMGDFIRNIMTGSSAQEQQSHNNNWQYDPILPWFFLA